MKILQVIQRLQLRGAEMFATQLCRELRASGLVCDITVLFDGKEDLPVDGISVTAIHANRQRRLADFAAYRRLDSIVRDGAYDIVQANAGDTLKYAVISKMMFGWKAKLVFRNANKMSDFIRNPFHRAFNSFLLSRCDHIISVSDSCRTDIITTFPQLAGRATTVTIGTYPVVNAGRPQPAEFVIVNVASFVPEKNHLFLLEIFHLFRQRHKTGVLWLAGDGKLRPQIEMRVRELGLAEHVKLWGYRMHVGDLLEQSAVMVLPSKIEGLPAVILEAFAYGLPVIASRVGGIPDVIEDGVNGFTIEGFNAGEYLEKIGLLLTDPGVRDRIVRNARDTVEQKFDIRVIACKFAQVYEQIRS